MDKDLNSCVNSESEIDLYEFLSSGSIDFSSKNYAKEFNYTNNHVSIYHNNMYYIVIYKDVNCISKLSIDVPKIDFGSCYEKVQNNLTPPTTNKIVVSLIEKLNSNKKSTTSYFFYHPDTGEKIDADTICKDEEIVIKDSVLSQLNDSKVDLGSALFLSEQDVDIFDLNGRFYTDICYEFKSPNGKDIPVKERIHIYYPNITLCEPGCTNKGVNLTSLESICECKYNLLNNDLVEGNQLLESSIGEITNILSNSNLDVLKCFKNIFKLKNIYKGVGGLIMIGILVFDTIFGIKFLLYDINAIMRYLYDLTNSYIDFLSKEGNNKKINDSKIVSDNSKNRIKSPPRKIKNNYVNDEIYSKSQIQLKNDSKCATPKTSKKKLSDNLYLIM